MFIVIAGKGGNIPGGSCIAWRNRKHGDGVFVFVMLEAFLIFGGERGRQKLTILKSLVW